MGYFNNRRNAGRAQERIHPKSDTGAARRGEQLDSYAENSSKVISEGEGKPDKYTKKMDISCAGCMGQSAAMLIDFSNPSDEMQTERDFRMLQSMYPNAAKELLPYIEEECDRMEYDGSAMFDEYPDFTTVYRVQKTILEAGKQNSVNPSGEDQQNTGIAYGDAPESTGIGFKKARENTDAVPKEDLIRVMLLQEMHRRRERRRSCR
ncbi:MAG: hypothetical protein LUI13_04865 [Lachnospiraceae bacterium]|nr:hypothetical protein [Lachnospiraceae bacterium]